MAAPAPAPLLISPAGGATNVDPDPALMWRWVDELIQNGSFETGLTPGWSVSGPNPTVWQVYTDSTNASGMGYRWATTLIPNLQHATSQLIQDFQIPITATSATLEWKQRVWNMVPTILVGRLRTYLYENGSAILLIDSATGSESIYAPHQWVLRSTNLLAYAGRSLQLVFLAETYSPVAVNSWFADIDGIKLSCEHPANPDFHVYVANNPSLRTADLVAQTTETNYCSVVLEPYTTYYWRVDAVRDGSTNQSAVSSFRTRQRYLPQLRIISATDLGVRLGFDSHLNRFYTVEQAEELTGPWFNATVATPGTGDPMQLEVLPPGTSAYWRLRISP